MDQDLFELFDVIDSMDSFEPDGISIDSDSSFDDVADLFIQQACVELVDIAIDTISNYVDHMSNDPSLSPDHSNANELTSSDSVPDISINSDVSWLEETFEYIYRICQDLYYQYIAGSDDIVTEHHFTNGGSYDTKNDVIAEGNVLHDLQFTQQQTHSSCSLMAQEQFVHRYTGQAIPEDYLEWYAEKQGVYSPDLGTIEEGHTMILEHFNIPFEKSSFMGIEDLDNAISENKDIIIGVDAREFYGDPSIPPGSGHAVAVIGRGVNPTTHELEGFYVTDSNFPESAHFISVDKMEASWWNDMITIPEIAV